MKVQRQVSRRRRRSKALVEKNRLEESTTPEPQTSPDAYDETALDNLPISIDLL
jgi:hypothetical protein